MGFRIFSIGDVGFGIWDLGFKFQVQGKGLESEA